MEKTQSIELIYNPNKTKQKPNTFPIPERIFNIRSLNLERNMKIPKKKKKNPHIERLPYVERAEETALLLPMSLFTFSNDFFFAIPCPLVNVMLFLAEPP